LKVTCSSDPPIARRHVEQCVNRQLGVFIVSFDFLGDFPLVALVRSWAVVREGFRAGELVV
jgi:hypothetical protein